MRTSRYQTQPIATARGGRDLAENYRACCYCDGTGLDPQDRRYWCEMCGGAMRLPTIAYLADRRADWRAEKRQQAANRRNGARGD